MVIGEKDRWMANKLSAFTLIEMMVVIGIIAIVTLGAVPGLKKAYADFRDRQDLEILDTFISSTRSYALLMSEYPHHTYFGRWAYEANWVIPRYFTSGGADVGNTVPTLEDGPSSLGSWLRVKPYRGTDFTIDQQLTEPVSFLKIGIHEGNGTYNSLLRERYPTYVVNGDVLYFPELYHVGDELQAHRNRYY